ncbi:glycosyltransferase [Desulfovibrio sp. OttesenSCG-928-C14]|nr:glycosyltransferase [Desulfovibrio sp. OttesenSCG-928-C14]
MPEDVVLNITMPVYNRLHFTQASLLALRKTRSAIPFSVTVVDNGSDADLVDKLREFKKIGVIDKLFLLPENMGISCAANLGWLMTEAPFYMKLDNDTLFKRQDWPDRLFRLWSHGQPLSNLGGAYTEEMLLEHPGALHTPDGILGICHSNLGGQAIIVPRAVSDLLGYWNEDYGLYGAEDGDYGKRMKQAGLPQYYYLGPDYFEDLSSQEEIVQTYYSRSFDRQAEYWSLFRDGQGGTGLFYLNEYLYQMCIRNWRVPLRYEVLDLSGDGRVKLGERQDYELVREALRKSKEAVDEKLKSGREAEIYSQDFVAALTELWEGIGQGMSGFYESLAALEKEKEQ